MALPASEDWNETSGPLNNPPWTASTGYGTYAYAYNLYAQGSVGVWNMAFWNADSFPDNQYSQSVVPSGESYQGPAVRCTGANGYGLYCPDSTKLRFYKFSSGPTAAQLGSDITGLSLLTKTVKLTVTGSNPAVLTAYVDGSSVGTVNDASSPYTSGSAGICSYGASYVGAWGGGAVGVNYSRGDVTPLPSDDADLETIISDKTNINSINSIYIDQTASGQYAIFLFKDVVTGVSADFTWYGKSDLAPSSSIVKMQAYQRTGVGAPQWVDLDTDNATGANTDFYLNGTISSGDIANYKDGSNVIATRVWQQAV